MILAEAQPNTTIPILGYILTGIGASIVTAVFGWLAARFRYSGKVETSEAATLWKAAENIRRDLAEEARRARDNHLECERKRQELERQVERQREQIAELYGLIGSSVSRAEGGEDGRRDREK